jgi:hypothetical protein
MARTTHATPAHPRPAYQAVRDDTATPPWRVVLRGQVVAVVHSRTARADAERIAAAMNAVAGITTADLKRGLVGRFWLLLGRLEDFVRGVLDPATDDPAVARARARVLAEAREILGDVTNPSRRP